MIKLLLNKPTILKTYTRDGIQIITAILTKKVNTNKGNNQIKHYK